MRIVMLGAPGSGKGTQAQRIQKDHGLPQVSTGDLLRRAVADKTPLGLKAKKAMDAGELVSDEIVLGMIKERIAQPDAKRGFILDGFPRNTSQANSLDALLAELKLTLDRAVLMDVDFDILMKRLTGRRTCSKTGADAQHLFLDARRARGVPQGGRRAAAARRRQRRDDSQPPAGVRAPNGAARRLLHEEGSAQDRHRDRRSRRRLLRLKSALGLK